MSSFENQLIDKINPFSSLEIFYNSPSTTVITLSASVAMGGAFKECVQTFVSDILQPLVHLLISFSDMNYSKKNITFQFSNVIASLITFILTVLLIKLYVEIFYDKILQSKLMPK